MNKLIKSMHWRDRTFYVVPWCSFPIKSEQVVFKRFSTTKFTMKLRRARKMNFSPANKGMPRQDWSMLAYSGT